MGDAAACAAIYAPYVTDTAITFETEPPTPAELERRIAAAQHAHVWLVLEELRDPGAPAGTGGTTGGAGGTAGAVRGGFGEVVGYAYGVPYKPRAAYRWSCEVSVYLGRGRRRTGAGRALYEALFARLAARGYRTAVAGMTLPNDASVGLHRAMGFEVVGTYRAIGWKHGAWHDVTMMQRPLTTTLDPPTEPR